MAEVLIFGASGISGWPLMRECLNYPTPTTFSRIIGLTNRPCQKENALLPNDSRIELYSGFDLSKKDEVEQKLRAIKGIEKVTYVYFAAYTSHSSEYKELVRANAEILQHAVDAVEKLCPNLKFWTLQTGGKAYGAEFYGHVPYHPPHKESSPRIPEPYASNVFYYAQYDVLARAVASKPWTFCEIRPDAIIGFVPANNFMNLAQGLGLFLAVYRHVHGDGATVPFPGGEQAWRAWHTDTFQDLLARFHIHASLHPKDVAERAFNVADGAPVRWMDTWPGLVAYFGLQPGELKSGMTVKGWMAAHQVEAEAWAKETGVRTLALEGANKGGWEFVDMLFGIPFDRQFDLSRIREVGFQETIDHVEGYKKTWDRMKEAKFLP